MRVICAILLVLLCSCRKAEKHWDDQARDKVDVDVVPSGKWK